MDIGVDKPYIVLVPVTVRREMLEEFEPVLIDNARESVTRDPAACASMSVRMSRIRRGGA